MIKTDYKMMHGFKLEVLVYRTNSGANGIGPNGELSDPKLAKMKPSNGSSSASISVGQSPKDKGLAALDAIADRDTPKDKVKVRKGKPSKAKGHDKRTKSIRRRESTHRSKPRGRRNDRVFRSVTAILAAR